MDGDPVEEMRDLEMRDENHDAEQKNNRVPTDRAIRAAERNDSDEHHGYRAAKRGGGAVEMAAATTFDGNQYVGDEENDDGEPVNVSEQRSEGLSGWKHQECGSLSRRGRGDNRGCAVEQKVRPNGLLKKGFSIVMLTGAGVLQSATPQEKADSPAAKGGFASE